MEIIGTKTWKLETKLKTTKDALTKVAQDFISRPPITSLVEWVTPDERVQLREIATLTEDLLAGQDAYTRRPSGEYANFLHLQWEEISTKKVKLQSRGMVVEVRTGEEIRNTDGGGTPHDGDSRSENYMYRDVPRKISHRRIWEMIPLPHEGGVVLAGMGRPRRCTLEEAGRAGREAEGDGGRDRRLTRTR